MTEKLLTIEELITELRKLSDNTVIKVEYNQWLHNHPYGKIQVTVSIDDAKKVLVDDNARLEERIQELEQENKTLKDTIDGLTDTLAHTIDITSCGDVE